MPNLRDTLKRQIMRELTAKETAPTPSQFIAQLRASTAEMRTLENLSLLTGRPVTMLPPSYDLNQ